MFETPEDLDLWAFASLSFGQAPWGHASNIRPGRTIDRGDYDEMGMIHR